MTPDRPNTVAGLVAKRAEIAGQIVAAKATLRQLIIDLDHVDAAIRLFDPDIDLATIKPRPLPPPHKAYRGQITRIVLDALREAKGPLTTKQLAQHVMAERGLNTADVRLVGVFSKRLGATLRHHRDRGLLRQIKDRGEFVVWEVAP
jgi:hypothetical protein